MSTTVLPAGKNAVQQNRENACGKSIEMMKPLRPRPFQGRTPAAGGLKKQLPMDKKAPATALNKRKAKHKPSLYEKEQHRL